jgi:pimeloyl-ACP methyl ester carboxylesterase
VREERLEVDGVPARLYDPGGGRGLLLLGHGGAHSKDGPRFVRLCRTHAEGTGLAVVCIDAVGHGERRPSPGAGAGTGGGRAGRGAESGTGLPARWHSTNADRMVADWRCTADALAEVGPAVAYVGFSMGMIFGAPTVAAMPTIRAVAYVVGGIPTGAGIDDPPLRDRLLEAAAGHGHAEVLMVNVTDDDVFRVEDVHAFFDAVPGRRKRLTFWPGRHDDWPDEAIRLSVAFLEEHTR